MMTLAQALQWLHALPGVRPVGALDTRVLRVHTDTRTLAAGDLFVALKGERFDANDFLAEAKARGAVAAIAQRGLEAAGLPGLEVPDTLAALGRLAAGWRAQFTLPLIAVTGSNGKTTVTQMIAAILKTAYGARALATEGNFNNEIGVPLTLLRLRAQHQAAVVELGMNHPGEIARLAALAQPTVALVNNAQREHQEFMHSVEAVAQENGAVFAALPPRGMAVFPHDDAYTPLWTGLAVQPNLPRSVLTFSANTANTAHAANRANADATCITLSDAQWLGEGWQMRARTPQGELRTTVHIAGRHNLCNALAATACTLAVGVALEDIARGLASFTPVKGRSLVHTLHPADGRALTLIDDSYNANPDSVRAAIDVLADLPGPRLLVLGDMGEVGAQGARFHAEIGHWARTRGIDALYALGDLSAHAITAYGPGPNGRHFETIDTLMQAVLARLPQQASVLVKGSRFMRMERVVQAALASYSQQSSEAGHVV
ncbi:MAG: UDP-N-acetylmuramoyl-tripeptide--D-alanyl-D-alanine ligase [Burkholderiaceae bacterium]|jgi:UDP-N-acetylmuramoyl-tripeptide--D-alanyl-D-alanine ligase|nr:UDP-N-acetylmuramoyl-tripeptide--D-alanyl-D-alanine ligase [Burkholderiaceae bacterium]